MNKDCIFHSVLGEMSVVRNVICDCARPYACDDSFGLVR